MTDVAYIDRPNRPLYVYAIFYLAFLYIPVMFLPLFSFNDNIYITFPLKGFTIQWYVAMFKDQPMWAALNNSLRVACTSSAIATLLGLFVAKAVTRYRIPGVKPIIFVIMLPMVVPLIIMGVALLILVTRLGFNLSLHTITMAHVLISVPFATATLISRFEGFDPSMEEASSYLGAGPWSTFWRVTLPMVAPGVLASFLLCFTISFDDFIMAFFLGGTDPTLPIFIWGQLRFPFRLPGVLALGSLILIISFVVVFISLWLRRWGVEDTQSGI